jgi:uncharacterized repeat protein (TIGR01451 family)
MGHRWGVVARVLLAAGIGLTGAAFGMRAYSATIVSEYADWTVSGQAGTFSVPGSGFPSGAVASDTTLRAPSGKSTYLNNSTPFGQEFGESQNRSYLSFGTARGGKPSTTTVTFDTATPVGSWGFTLGDIDADKAKVTAIGADGKALTTDQLGWKGAFNYCATTPRPGSCTRHVYTDVPTWNAGTSTLVGSGTDTDGASGWFMPTVSIKTLTVEFSVQSGIPIGQLWMAARFDTDKPDVVVSKHAYPATAFPGSKVTYTITVDNMGLAPEPDAEVSDDLSDLLDAARYNNDAHADGGTVTYSRPVLTWKGHLDPGQAVTTTYSVTIDNPYRGNGMIRNVVVATGSRLTCQQGKGAGCAASVVITRGGGTQGSGSTRANTGFGGMAGSVRHHQPRP